MIYDEILAFIEKKIGKEPRRFNFFDRHSWFIQDKPGWDWQKDDIKHSVLNWERCFKQGKLAWGHIIQANSKMFDETEDLGNNCPGELLIWTDEDYGFDEEMAGNIAHALYELKGNSANIQDEEEKAYATHLENEMTRKYGVKIPSGIASGLDLYASTIFYQRRHIPGKGHALKGSIFPVLYLNETPMVVVMVPGKFWPKPLLEYWFQ